MGDTDTATFMNLIETPKELPYSLSNIENFPNAEYSKLVSRYTECERWYSGEALDESKTQSGTAIKIYPVRVNPIPGGVQKHSFALFGEVEEDEKPLVSAKVVTFDDGDKAAADKVEQTLSQIWWENNGRAIQWQNGAMSQVYGGCIFKASYDPYDPLRSIPIRIEIPHPKYFVGIPDANDMWRLQEAWLIKPITKEEAATNGYESDVTTPEEYWLIEHWTTRIYEATINGKPVRRQMSDGEWVSVSGENKDGVVPIVYIPHIRLDGFYGENFFDNVKGIIREMNLRIADYGDAVSVDSHAYVFLSNMAGAPDIISLAPGMKGVVLPGSPMITGQEAQPTASEVRTNRASDAMASLFNLLFDQYRRDAFIPKVADGEDEGSQRSGLTLAMRMLALLWHTQIERYFWTTGLNLFGRIILRILAVRDSKGTGISLRHVTMRTKQEWSPVLPRDREMLVNEVVARAGAAVSSPETLFDILGDIADTEQEKKRILEWKEAFTKATAVQQPGSNGTDRKKVAPGTPTRAPSESE